MVAATVGFYEAPTSAAAAVLAESLKRSDPAFSLETTSLFFYAGCNSATAIAKLTYLLRPPFEHRIEKHKNRKKNRNMIRIYVENIGLKNIGVL